MSGKFQLAFYNEAAAKDYRKLDSSARKLVNVALRKLETRADEIGTPLGRELAGCKKVKWRNAGLRMVFRIVDEETVEIVEIIAIGQRDKERVYRLAGRRLDASVNRVAVD